MRAKQNFTAKMASKTQTVFQKQNFKRKIKAQELDKILRDLKIICCRLTVSWSVVGHPLRESTPYSRPKNESQPTYLGAKKACPKRDMP